MANTKITVANMAANSIDSDQYVDGSIDTAHIADGQITVGKMAANSVDSAQYVDGSIDTAHYADNSITGAELADNIVIAGTLGSTGKITADAGIDIDNFNIDGTTLALSSGDMVIDVAGNLQLDADDSGEVRFLDAGTTYATIKKDGNNALFQSIVADGDFIIQGIDGSSFISAVTFDMSNAGTATFNHDINLSGDIDASGQIFVGGQNSTFAENNLRFLSGGAAYIDHSTVGQDFIFRTSASSALDTTALTIQHDGNLLIGGTNPAPVSNNVAGISLRAVNGEAQISVAGAAALYLNRKTNDGALAYFRKDGGTIGALATAGGDLIIGSHNTCLRFDDSADDILPTDDGGVVVNNTLSLGSASARFKELWIGSSPLDDYEEGTYNATISCASGSITLYSSYTALRYTKIGRQVHIHGKLAMQAVSSPSGATNLNLPFASANDTNRSGVAANIMTGYFNGSAVTNGIYPIYGDIAEASSDCRLFIMLPPATNNLGDNHVAAGSDIHVNFTYTVQ